MATGDKKRAVMTDDINNPGSAYPVMPLKTIDQTPTAGNTDHLISSAGVKSALDPIQAALNAFTAHGHSYSGQTSVNITLPERAAFNEYAPLFVICTYRGQESSDKNGIAVLKNVSGPIIAYKAGATSLTGFAYDAATRVLTLSCEQYMTFLVIGRLSAI